MSCVLILPFPLSILHVLLLLDQFAFYLKFLAVAAQAVNLGRGLGSTFLPSGYHRYGADNHMTESVL